MTIEFRTKLKDNLAIAATILSILLSSGALLGGMRWVSRQEAADVHQTEQMITLSGNVERVTLQVQEIDRWRHAYEVEMAPIKWRAEEFFKEQDRNLKPQPYRTKQP